MLNIIKDILTNILTLDSLNPTIQKSTKVVEFFSFNLLFKFTLKIKKENPCEGFEFFKVYQECVATSSFYYSIPSLVSLYIWTQNGWY